MAKALKEFNKTVDYIELEKAGHGLDTREQREIVLGAMEAFLSMHIGRKIENAVLK